jgi:hypothetical protein
MSRLGRASPRSCKYHLLRFISLKECAQDADLSLIKGENIWYPSSWYSALGGEPDLSTNNKIRTMDEFPFPSKDPGCRDYYGWDLEHYLDRYCPGLTEQELEDLLASQGITKTVFPGRDSSVIRGLGGLDVLQICLLKTEPFNFDGALGNLSQTIQDVRIGQKLPCEDRPQLLASLAEALASFQNQYDPITPRTDMRVVYTEVSTRKIGNLLNTYFSNSRS